MKVDGEEALKQAREDPARFWIGAKSTVGWVQAKPTTQSSQCIENVPASERCLPACG